MASQAGPGGAEAHASPPGAAARPTRSLRSYLVLLVLAVLLPALAFGAAASWEALRQRDAAAEARLLDTARAVAAAVDVQIGAQIAALEALGATAATEGSLAAPSPAFADNLRTTATILDGWITLHDRDGRLVFSTRTPGEAGAEEGGLPVREVIATGRPVVADVAVGPPGGRPYAFVLVPLTRRGQVQGALGMPLLPERLAATLARQATGNGGTIAVTDSRGVFATRTRNPEQVVGQARPRREAPLAGRSGVLRGRTVPDGAPIRTAYHALESAPGWHVWVNEPEAGYAAARLRTIAALAGGGALALAIGLVGAVLVSHRLLAPVQALVARADAVAAGAPDAAPPAPAARAAVREFERLRRAVTAAEARLRRVQRIGRVGGFEIDLRTGRNQRSAEYMDRQGRPPSAAEERHEDWVRRLHPEDRARAEARFLAAIADAGGDTDYEQEYRIVTPAGEVRWIYARAEIERDAAGHALRMVGAHVDVTPLKLAEAALRDSEERLRVALEAARLGAWEVDLVTGKAQRTRRALEIFGYGSEEETAIYPSWRERVDPAHRGLLAQAVDAVRAGRQEEYRVEYRFQRPDGRWIWVESHGRAAGRDPATGLPLRLIGASLDITARKEAEERQALLIQELDHRAKNTLAVVQAALRLTPREDAEAYAHALEGRVAALAQAHKLLAAGRWRGAGMRAVVQGALAPFLGEAPAPRIGAEGPDLPLSPAAVQALSMTLHELGTNAAKHGALSQPGGRVALAWAVRGPVLHLSWDEQGGPPLAAAPTAQGFGASLVDTTIRHQLGGTQHAEWRAGGLLWEAALPLDRLRAWPEPDAQAGARPAPAA
jgi:PAS domain S-box-containing protein